jgi:hypothetical protein
LPQREKRVTTKLKYRDDSMFTLQRSGQER